jgi:hypothetical protein
LGVDAPVLSGRCEKSLVIRGRNEARKLWGDNTREPRRETDLVLLALPVHQRANEDVRRVGCDSLKSPRVARAMGNAKRSGAGMHTHLIFWRNCIVVTDVRRDARSLQIEHAPRLTYVPECHQTHVLKDSPCKLACG